MNPTPDLWVHEREAAELLAIKNSTIRTMRQDGRLPPGDHFIFATGTAGGPVSYNVTAIRKSMAEGKSDPMPTSFPAAPFSISAV